MVRRDNHHGVNIRPGQQLAIVVVRRAAAVPAFRASRVRLLHVPLAFFPPGRIHIADGQDLNLTIPG